MAVISESEVFAHPRRLMESQQLIKTVQREFF